MTTPKDPHPPQYEDAVTPSKDTVDPATDHIEKTKGNDVLDEKELVQGRDYAGAVAKTDPREIKLVRKLDMRIMVCFPSQSEPKLLLRRIPCQPTLFAMYFLNYVDRNTLAQARLNGLEEDLGMHGSQFNTTISILFVGYVLTQVPSNMLITRISPSIYMSSWMVLWSAVSGLSSQ